MGNTNNSVNNFVTPQTLVTSAAGTTTLSVSSTRIQQLRGTQAQTFKLPDARTLLVGWTYEFNNNSTGLLTIINNSTGSTLYTVPSGGYVRVSASTVSTQDGTWDGHFLMPSNTVYGTSGLTITGNLVVTQYTNVNHAASPYTVLSTDYYLSVDCSGGAVTLNFPNSPTAGQAWYVKDRTGNASTNNISITTPGGSVTFDGQTTYTMNANYESVIIYANSTPTYEVN